MPKNKPLDRYVEAGKEFTEASRRCLETIAHDLAREGEAGREHAEDWAEELVERGRRAAEQLGDLVKREVREQIKQFNLATNQDVIKVVQHFVERTTKAAAPVMDVASRTVTATKKAARRKSGTAKKSAARKAPATKAAAKKAPATKAAARKAPATKKPAAKKASVKQAAAKKTTAKKAPAKKAAATEQSQANPS